MGIRGILTLLFLGTTAVAAGLIYILVLYLKGRLAELFPPELSEQADVALQLLVMQESILLVFFALILIVSVFWTVSHLIVRPLQLIINAMTVFSETGERVPLPDLSYTPKEVHTLAKVFQKFVDSVDEVHKHDMEISRVKSDFISTAAHQLRTPLTGIRWALEALEKDPALNEEQKALVTSAKDKSHDLVDTVGTLLDISSIESGKYKYKFESLDLGQLVGQMTRDFAQLADRSQVSLFYAGGEEKLPRVLADKNRVKWILNNLIENAIRYTPAGGTVRVYATVTATMLKIHVRDTGIGIPSEDRGNIFERFYRAPNAITKENQGNGLGLYIARTIATDHGGDLDFAPNEEGPGTIFTLSLPIESV